MVIDNQILARIENLLKCKIIDNVIISQGEGYLVFSFTDENKAKYIAKIGDGALTDALVIDLISKSGLDIPIPKLKSFLEVPPFITVMESIPGKLLRDIDENQKLTHIKPLIEYLHELHAIKSPDAGEFLSVHQNKNLSWSGFLKLKYSNSHPSFNWGEIIRKIEDNSDLLFQGLENVNKRLKEIDYNGENSLMHCDINVSNVIININTNQINGIIDWSEALYGDPLYDFARFRMNLLRKLGDDGVNEYFRHMNLNEKDKYTEDTYFLCHSLDYINWYVLQNDKEHLVKQMEILNNFLK